MIEQKLKYKLKSIKEARIFINNILTKMERKDQNKSIRRKKGREEKQ